jgi:hypothetical protein
MTRLQQELITYITLTNVYNSKLAALAALLFKRKDEILVGGPAEAVLFAFSVLDQAQICMSAHPGWVGKDPLL